MYIAETGQILSQML